MLLRQVKGRMDAHRGRVILIQTQLLKHIGEIETQGMGTIAEIQPNTLETLKVREAKEGQLSPKTKHNEAITILFKPGIEGNIYGIEGAIRKWVHSKLKSIARSPCHYYLLHKGQLFTNATSLKLSLLKPRTSL